MTNLFLSIFFTSSLIILFKYFDRFSIPILPAIVVNYFTAGILGCIHAGRFPVTGSNTEPWLWIAVPLGVLFISVFYTIALTTQKLGVSAATVANKMSMVIPVSAAFIMYGDNMSAQKITGIILALAAVYFTNRKKIPGAGVNRLPLLILPLVVFTGSGIIDTMVNYAQQHYLRNESSGTFLATAFFSAGLTGALLLFYLFFNNGKTIPVKSIAAGICLGIPNYLSIWFLIETLNTGGLESSVVYPLNNIGIVLFSALYAYIFFNERLNRMNTAGILLAIVSILLINFA